MSKLIEDLIDKGFKSADMQVEICKLVGMGAKRAGSKKNWKQTQTLYWRGKEIKSDSPEYQELLDRAYEAMFEQSESFRKALEASKGSTLTHSIGKRNSINNTGIYKSFEQTKGQAIICITQG